MRAIPSLPGILLREMMKRKENPEPLNGSMLTRLLARSGHDVADASAYRTLAVLEAWGCIRRSGRDVGSSRTLSITPKGERVGEAYSTVLELVGL